MSMKDLLSKMTELQGTVESVEVAPVTATGKKVLNESSNTMKESTKPSLKSIFSSLLSEAEQVTIQPAKQNTQVIKQGQKTLGTVENPQLAQQIKQSIGKGEMSLAGDELQEDDMAEGLDPAQKQKLKSLIYAYRDATDPFGSEYDLDPSVVIDRIRQEFGDKIADTISQGPSMHFPRPGHVSGVYDPLANKSSPRVTKLGKINRQDAETMKRNIKQQQGMTESKLTEKAVSKSQQQAAGAALAAKRGDAPKSKLTGASKEMAKMPAKELEKFAKTKHKGLPEKKKTNEGRLDKSKYFDNSVKPKAGDRVITVSSSGTRGAFDFRIGDEFEVVKVHRDKDNNEWLEVKVYTPENPMWNGTKLRKWIESTKVRVIKPTNEAAMPTHDGDFGAGLGAGRNSKTLESKKAKPDYIDLDKDGNKKESMKKAAADATKKVAVKEGRLPKVKVEKRLGKYAVIDDGEVVKTFIAKYEADEHANYLNDKKAAADKQKVSTMKKTNEAKAKPDFLDLDKDGDKKESMKKAQADKKPGSDDKKSSAGLTAAQKKLPAGLQKAVAKKKTVKEGANPTEAARLLGKAHAMGKDPFACKYEAGTTEAQAYLDGYKEGLDECYGSGGGMGMQQDIGMMPGMDSIVSQDSMMDSPSPRGGSEFAFGGFDEVSDDDMMAFESWDRELNALLNEAVTPKFQVRYLPNNRDTYKIEKGFASKKEAQDWIKGENLRDRAEDISIETSTSKEVNEGKMKDLDMDLGNAKGEPALSDAKFKEKYGKTKAEMKKSLASDSKKPVKEGISVSVSKGQQGAPDSVSVTAQDGDADALLAMIKQAGLGLFGGDEPSGYGSPASAATQPVGDIGDHDSMMALIKKMSSTGNDYEDEESQDDQHVHGHPDAACGVCGSSDCGCDDESDSKALVVGEEQGYDDKEDESLGMRTGKESGKEQSMKDRRDDSYGKFGKRTDEDESEDQMEFEVAESNAPDSGEAETTADENAEAKEDQALAGAMSGDEEEIDEGSCSMDEEEELTEWANDAGYEGSENIKDNTFEQDIEFMTRIISGGLNGPKKDQTTLPHTRVKVDESRQAINDWKKLSGIK